MQTVILIFNPYTHGGLADYGQAQGRALAAIDGVKVLWLSPYELREPEGSVRAGMISIEKPITTQNKLSIWLRLFRYLRYCLLPVYQLDAVLKKNQVKAVLLTSYAEYGSPFWAWRLRRWKRRGVKFGAVVHDPVRDHRVGFGWWHRWSISEAYSFLDVAFVHYNVSLDTGFRSFPTLKTVVIPHGIYNFQSRGYSKVEARHKLNLSLGAFVFLSFGHIRDGKNLDLFIQNLPDYKIVHLIVAGLEQSSGQKSSAIYKKLADNIGVNHRICWHVRHIPESEIGLFFGAADFLLLTYSSDFRSASGVLAAAAQFRKPVLASSGSGPLKSAVQQYHLGHWVEPDDGDALKQGIQRCLTEKLNPQWAAFEEDHSWELNAEIVFKSLGC